LVSGQVSELVRQIVAAMARNATATASWTAPVQMRQKNKNLRPTTATGIAIHLRLCIADSR
jgi:hypothetical protein